MLTKLIRWWNNQCTKCGLQRLEWRGGNTFCPECELGLNKSQYWIRVGNKYKTK